MTQFHNMKVIGSAPAMQRLAKRWKAKNAPVGFVPTMGYLHDGHLSLVKRARQAVGSQGRVVVSIYVNPIQFAPHEDLARYPRDMAKDKRLCQEAGVDAVFAPGDAEMYPAISGQQFSTFVAEESLSKAIEGTSRPAHFKGVTTVVAKLFNIVLPDVAVFGAKDFQQALIIKRLTRDLNFPVKVIVAPTRREHDGLAMSSRNEYLSAGERLQAVVLWQAIQRVIQAVRSSAKPLPASRLKNQLRAWIERQPAARVEYIEFFDPVTLAPVNHARRGSHMALAVYIGNTRLIDNAPIK